MKKNKYKILPLFLTAAVTVSCFTPLCAGAKETEKTDEEIFEEYIPTLKEQKYFDDAYLIDVDNDKQPELVAAYIISDYGMNFMMDGKLYTRPFCYAKIFECVDDIITENTSSYSMLYTLSADVLQLNKDFCGFFMTDHPEEFVFTDRCFCTDGNFVYLKEKESVEGVPCQNETADSWIYSNRYSYITYRIEENGIKVLDRYVNNYTTDQEIFYYTAEERKASAHRITDKYFRDKTQEKMWGIPDDSTLCDKSVYDTGINYFNSMKEMPVFNGNKGADLYRYWRKLTVYLNGEKINFPDGQPIRNKLNGDVLVPIRAIAEAMGDKVLWNQKLQTAFIRHTDRVLIAKMLSTELTIAMDECFDNWSKYTMNSMVCSSDGSTLVPVRAFCESLTADVNWNSETLSVEITYSPDKLGEALSDNDIENINAAYFINNEFADFKTYTDELDEYNDSRNKWIDAGGIAYSDITHGATQVVLNGFSIKEARTADNKEQIRKSIAKALAKIEGCGNSEITVSEQSSAAEIINGIYDIVEDFYDESFFIKSASTAKKKADKVIDWTGFTADQVAYLLNDYTENVKYLQVIKDAGTNELISEVVDEMIAEYTLAWLNSSAETAKKVYKERMQSYADEIKDNITLLKDVSVLYDVFTFAIDTTNTIIGLNEKVSGIYDLCAIREYDRYLDGIYSTAAIQVKNQSKLAMIDKSKAELGKAFDDFKRIFKLQKAVKMLGYEAIQAAFDNSDIDSLAKLRLEILDEMDFILWKEDK